MIGERAVSETNKLRLFRESLGLSAAKMSQILGISELSQYHYESGKSHPMMKNWVKMRRNAKKYDIILPDFIFEDDYEINRVDDTDNTIRSFRQLREKIGLTRLEMSQYIGVSYVMWYRYEEMMSDPPANIGLRIERCAKLYGCIILDKVWNSRGSKEVKSNMNGPNSFKNDP